MPAPAYASSGNLTCATGSTDLNHLLGTSATTGAVRIQTIAPSIEAQELDVTGFGLTSAVNTLGLSSGSVNFTGIYPKVNLSAAAISPRLGNTGLLTVGGSAVAKCSSFTLNIEFGEDDITDFETAPTWMRYRPLSVVRWSGSWTARLVEGTLPTLPGAAASAGVAAIFKLTEDSTNDPSFTGSIVVPRGPRYSADARQGGSVELTYDFVGTGDLTAVAGTAIPCILPAGVVDPSNWDMDGDGTPDVTVTLVQSSGLSRAGFAFLRSLSITARVDALTAVDGVVRFTDVLA